MPIPSTPRPKLPAHSFASPLLLLSPIGWFACHSCLAGRPRVARLCRTSISRMSSKEKITLHEREKHPPPALQTPPAEEEEEEQPNTQSRPGAPSKASSSSSSEEESESESDAESGERYEHCVFWNYAQLSHTPQKCKIFAQLSGCTFTCSI